MNGTVTLLPINKISKCLKVEIESHGCTLRPEISRCHKKIKNAPKNDLLADCPCWQNRCL